MAGPLGVILGLSHQILDLAAKSGFQEGPVKDNFIDLLKLGQSELFRHQVQGQIGVFKLVSQPVNGAGDYPGVIEGQPPIFQQFELFLGPSRTFFTYSRQKAHALAETLTADLSAMSDPGRSGV